MKPASTSIAQSRSILFAKGSGSKAAADDGRGAEYEFFIVGDVSWWLLVFVCLLRLSFNQNWKQSGKVCLQSQIHTVWYASRAHSSILESVAHVKRKKQEKNFFPGAR